MAKTFPRLKAKAQIYVPQSKDDAATDVREIGDLQRQALRASTEMNDAIAVITQKFQPRLEALSEQLKTLQEGVQAYCEAQWRQRPPSVSVRGAESVIEALKRLGLAKFVRVKDEINKEAILNEPEAVRGVAGITVVTGVEDFVITPFEQKDAA